MTEAICVQIISYFPNASFFILACNPFIVIIIVVVVVAVAGAIVVTAGIGWRWISVQYLFLTFCHNQMINEFSL